MRARTAEGDRPALSTRPSPRPRPAAPVRHRPAGPCAPSRGAGRRRRVSVGAEVDQHQRLDGQIEVKAQAGDGSLGVVNGPGGLDPALGAYERESGHGARTALAARGVLHSNRRQTARGPSPIAVTHGAAPSFPLPPTRWVMPSVPRISSPSECSARNDLRVGHTRRKPPQVGWHQVFQGRAVPSRNASSERSTRSPGFGSGPGSRSSP